MGRTLTLEEVKNRTAHDLLREVVQGHGPITVVLEEGAAVTLQETASAEGRDPALTLKPLLTLPGYVPEGWQDAIYDDH